MFKSSTALLHTLKTAVKHNVSHICLLACAGDLSQWWDLVKTLCLRRWREKNVTVQDNLLSKIPPLAAALIGSYTHSYKITEDERNISPKYYDAQFINSLQLNQLYHGEPKLFLPEFVVLFLYLDH